jgi:hypothetical protein
MKGNNSMNESRPLLFGLLRRRRCLVPTWFGWLMLLLLLGTAATLAVRNAYYFLAPTDPAPGGVLVVEGWGSDLFMGDAIAEFRRDHYEEMVVTGGPLEKGSIFIKYKTYAELSAAILEGMGLDSALVHAVPARAARQDRTYASAMALKSWFNERGMRIPNLTVMSQGPHSRRSRLLYEMVFGPGVNVGIISVRDEEIDPARWWTTSAGFRAVTDEMIAWLYARFLFHPPRERPSVNGDQ